MAQRYSHPTALARMSEGLCPECGDTEASHTGWGGPLRCSLTDVGVAVRIQQYRQDLAVEEPAPHRCRYGDTNGDGDCPHGFTSFVVDKENGDR